MTELWSLILDFSSLALIRGQWYGRRKILEKHEIWVFKTSHWVHKKSSKAGAETSPNLYKSWEQETSQSLEQHLVRVSVAITVPFPFHTCMSQLSTPTEELAQSSPSTAWILPTHLILNPLLQSPLCSVALLLPPDYLSPCFESQPVFLPGLLSNLLCSLDATHLPLADLPAPL